MIVIVIIASICNGAVCGAGICNVFDRQIG